MPAFTDYLDLRTAVMTAVGNVEIVDWFDTITQFAEGWLNRNLRTQWQITTASVISADAAAPMLGNSATLPSDFLEMIAVYDANGLEYIAQPIQAVQPIQGQYFWAIDNRQLVTSGFIGAYNIQYYAALTTITDALDSSNWLLSEYPDLYFYAVATEAAKWIKDMTTAQALMQSRDMTLREVMGADSSARYSRARVRVQGNVP